MTDEEYIRRELWKARKLTRDDTQAIKMRNSTNYRESRWVELPDHVADLVAAVAALTPEDAEALTAAIRAASATSDPMARIDRMILGLDMEGES